MSERLSSGTESQTSETIAALERQLYDAMIAEDYPSLDALLASGVSYVHSNGVVEDKDGYLQGVRDGLYEYDEIRSSDVAIRVFGDAAIATGTVLMSVGRRGEAKAKVPLLSTLVWIVEGGRWRLLRRHATRIPERS